MAHNSRHKRFAPVVEIAESRQEEAAKKLAHLMQFRTELQQQVNQLKTYREDYKRKQLMGVPLHTVNLRDRQIFLGRLNDNISELEEQLATVQKNLLSRMEYWKSARARTKALDKVMTRFKLLERKEQDRRLQKEQDEHASRQSYNDNS